MSDVGGVSRSVGGGSASAGRQSRGRGPNRAARHLHSRFRLYLYFLFLRAKEKGRRSHVFWLRPPLYFGLKARFVYRALPDETGVSDCIYNVVLALFFRREYNQKQDGLSPP